MMNVIDTKTFIDKAKRVHSERYDYSKVNYVNKRVKVEIICRNHGSFWLTPEAHTSGKQARGCPKCSIAVLALSKRKSRSNYIEDARRVHGKRYSYDRMVYLGKNAKVCISCPTHGDFWQAAKHHLEGSGCPKCAFALGYTNESFADKASRVHLGRYDYSKVVFTGVENHIVVVCRKHGEFRQKASSHLGGCGCPKCNSSTGERAVESILLHLGERYEAQKRFGDCLGIRRGRYGIPRELSFDFFLPDRMVLIEYDGKHHFHPMPFGSADPVGDFDEQKVRDKIKDEFAEKNGFVLIRIPYEVFSEGGFKGLSSYFLRRLGPKDMAKLL